MSYSSSNFQDNNLDSFNPQPEAPTLHKEIGTSQYIDGVRIDKEFHSIFNPEATPYYVSRGNARKIKVLFNNKIFDAEYRYEGQTNVSVVLQSIRFRKELKEEFKKVFPEPIGQFSIQQGIDLNHFVFSHKANNFIEDDYEYPEGKEAFRTHRIKERNPEVIRKAKERFKKKYGHLYCEVCLIDFAKVYGDRGVDFIEGHHKKLISEMKDGEKTKVEDIAMLCPNCHRMIHKKPLITVEQLRK